MRLVHELRAQVGDWKERYDALVIRFAEREAEVRREEAEARTAERQREAEARAEAKQREA